MRMLLLWPWPDQYPIKFANGEPIDQFWPNGNDAKSIGASLKARLEAGEYTHLFLHYRLGSANADAEGGFDADNSVEDVLDTLRVNPISIAPSVEYVIVYGNYSGSREVDREVNDFIHRLMIIAAPLFRRATDDLRARIYSVNTRQLFRQPAHSPQKHSMSLYGKLIGSIACDAFKLGTVQHDPNFYFRQSNLRAQVFLDQIGRARFMGAEAINRFEIATLSAYGEYFGKEEYVVDSPYRNYFPAINKHIEREGLERLFREGQRPEGKYLEEAMVLFEYAYDEERNAYTPFAVRSSNDLDNDKEFLALLPLLHTSAFYCEENAWSGTVQPLQRATKKNSGSGLIRLAFVMHRLESGRFKGTLNYVLIPRPGASGMPWPNDLENQAFDVLRPLVEATAIAGLSPITSAIVESKATELEVANRIASLSQVLSRTMSHNLGSHSLNAFATEDGMRKQFEEIECRQRHKACIPGRIVERDKEGDEANCTPATEACVKSAGEYTPCSQQEAEDLSKNRRELLARYNNYLRERMDFLADITTAVPAFETRTHFKDDLLKGFAENHLLTTTIAGSPGFDYCWNVVGEDSLVAIPSDVLGRHAFYIILENIVRNSAKHGGHREGVTYTVEVKPMTGKHADLLKVTIKDNETGRLSIADDQHPDYSKSFQSLIACRNEDIKDEVLGRNGRVREGAWGMLEMKACAAYLRCVPLEELDETKYHPREKADDPLESREALPLLEAVGDEKGFGYAFYVSRPKDVMVVGEDMGELFPALVQGQKEVLSEYGIGTMDLDTYAKGHVIKHGLLVFHKTTERGLKKFLTSLAADPNARPHEILIVGDVTEDGLAQSIAEANTGQAVQILSGTVLVGPAIAWPVFERDTLLKWASEQRTNWLVAKYKHERIGLAAVRTNLDGSEHGVLHRLRMLQQAGKRLDYDIDYAPHKGPKKFHDELYSRLPGITEKVLSAEATPADLDAAVLSSISTTKPDKSRPIQHFVLRYPSALDRVMAVRKNATQLAKDELGQHHLAYWLSNVAVIDERIQAAVHVSTYTPLVEDEKDREVIQVKHLLDMSGVFVPHRSIDLNGAYDQQLWDRLTAWLDERSSCLSYVVIHLSVFEKFLPNRVIGSIEEGLDRLRKELGHVRFIIASGRGKPPNMPKDELFISYSALSQYLTQQYQRSPLLLSILCRSARRLIQRP